MSTHIYEPSNCETRNIIARLENGKIYDESHNFSSLYITDAIDNKVYEVGNWEHQPWRFTTKDNTIYEYSNYLKGNVILPAIPLFITSVVTLSAVLLYHVLCGLLLAQKK